MSNDKLEIDINTENEQVVLGAIVNDHDTFLREVPNLTEDLFNTELHKDIFNALKELLKKGANYAVDSVIQISGERVKFKYLQDLEDNFEALPEENFRYHLEKLYIGSIKFKAVEQLSRLYEAMDDPHTSIDETSKHALEILCVLREGSLKLDRLRPGEDLYDDWYADVNDLRTNKIKNFVPTHFSALDEKLYEGLRPGKLIVIAGRPGMGKSTFCSNLTLRLGHFGKKVLSVPVEAGTNSVIDQMVCCKSRISAEKLIKRPYELTDEEMFQLKRTSRSILQSGNILFHDRMTSLEELEMVVEQEDFDAVILDLFEYLLEGDMDHASVTNKLRKLKQLAIRRNFAAVVVQQIKRIKRRKDPRPQLDELKNSGGYEEVADLVLLIHREAYYKKDLEEDIFEVNVAKQRRGIQNVTVGFKFHPDVCRVGAYTSDWEGKI